MKILMSLFILTATTAFAQSPRAYERPGFRDLASTPAPEEKPQEEKRPPLEKRPESAPAKKPAPSE